MGKENELGTTYNVTEADHNHPPRVVYRYERLEAARRRRKEYNIRPS